MQKGDREKSGREGESGAGERGRERKRKLFFQVIYATVFAD